MDPVTHFMTGAVLARSGFNRKAAYATLAMTLAAEAPDLDTVWSLGGPVTGFEHHRGWTHTLLGLPFEALAVLAAVFLWHRWRASRRPLPTSPSTPLNPTPDLHPAPIRWPLLYAFTLVALLSHLLLDWTNNYGLRPFFPFNPRWYSGSFVFIIEPVMLLLLFLGLVAPAFFGLIGSEVGARRQPFRGRGWAIAALLGIALLWTVRFFEHAQATSLALAGDFGRSPVLRTSLSPYPINPFLWHAVIETPTFSQLATANTWTGDLATDEKGDRFFKPPVTLATLAADRTELGHVFLDWSQFPLVTETTGPSAAGSLTDADISPAVAASLTVVTFRDLRFLYNVSLMHGREHPPIAGSVLLDPDHRPIRTEFNGKVQTGTSQPRTGR